MNGMNKIEMLMVTGSLEILVEGQERLTSEVNKLQMSICDEDIEKTAIAIGRLKELCNLSEKSCAEIDESLKKLYDCMLSEDFRKGTKKTDVRIDELDFEPRTYNCLCRAGIRTISQLIALTKEGGLRNIPSLGDRSFNEVVTKLKKLGIELED